MSNDPPLARGPSHAMASSGSVPQAVPALLQLKPCLKCARVPSNPQDHIAPNDLRPLVSAGDRFTSWLSPYGIMQMNHQTSILSLEIVIHRCLVMVHAVLPSTLKNYSPGLSRFIKFCDDFNIPETDRMPASEPLLCAFISTRSAGSIRKGTIKSWLLGIELWHRINDAPWNSGPSLQRTVEGASRLAPSSSWRAKRDPVTIQHLRALCQHLDLTNSFDIAVFAVACITFWSCCRYLRFRWLRPMPNHSLVYANC